MKRFLFIILLATPFLGKASHIVGGEFEIVHLQDFRYEVRLIIYFDEAHGDQGNKAQDINIFAKIFRYSDKTLVSNVTLPFFEITPVKYKRQKCAVGQLKTSRMLYKTIMEFPPNVYNDPQGYLILWERCCRNYEITNIYSEPTNNDPFSPLSAGQTFYLHFSPVVKNGVQFINSTPILFPPLSHYGCPGKPYWAKFSGTDNDGDSLAYSLVTPYNTHSKAPYPPILPDAPPITWRPGYGLGFNIADGNPDLEISTDGILTVTPMEPGLFVFAVLCEEFRDGVKIGDVRRDFQMFVLELCPEWTAPVVVGKEPGEPDFAYKDNMTVVFNPNAATRCVEIQISDKDIHNSYDGFEEFVKISVNTNKKFTNEIFVPSLDSAWINESDSVVNFSICFDECPPQFNTPYRVDIIVEDDACAVPLQDTLRLTVLVKTPENLPATFVTPNPDLIISLDEGSPKKIWPIFVKDGDVNADSLTVTYSTDGFLMDTVGMELVGIDKQVIQGIVTGSLSWDPVCDGFNFSTRQNFIITMVADDKDVCSYNKPDTARFNLTLIPPRDGNPTIDTDLTPVYSEEFVDGGTAVIYEKIEFNVFGHDSLNVDGSNYPISLRGLGIGYHLIDYQMNFPETTGNQDISSHFSWPLECNLFDLAEKDSFNIMFIVEDKNNKCKIYQADTLEVAFKILPPINTPPEITPLNLHPETETGVNTATSYWNQPIEFLLTGTDQDENPVIDNLHLELYDSSGNVLPAGFSFSPVSGQKEITSKFIWNPDCSIFTENDTLNTYQFYFRVFDDHCESADTAKLTLNINIKDYKSTDKYFDPASIITPNEDAKNDYFALDGYDLRENGTDPDNDVNFPLDNCLNRFEYINIYNRWGKLVFTSDNRFFRWYAPNAAAGVYYYFVKFTNKDYKGSVTVRY